jgi:hypothetical protein
LFQLLFYLMKLLIMGLVQHFEIMLNRH